MAREERRNPFMRLLYVALDQTVPGTLGGSVHVQAVAEGLAELGHDVHVATTPAGSWPTGAVTWHKLSPPLGHRVLRWARAGEVGTLARRVGADPIMDGYCNCGGEGVIAANRLKLPAVLEVNAPIVGYPGSAKARLDSLLLFEPMRRWRERLCRMTDLFVTPTPEVLPGWIDARRILRVEWGADTRHFRPEAT